MLPKHYICHCEPRSFGAKQSRDVPRLLRRLMESSKLLAMTVFIFAFSIFVAPPPACAKIVGKIVAVVNDQVITQAEVDGVLYPIYERYKEIYESEKELYEKLDEQRIEVIKQLVNDRLILGEARKLNISVDDRETQERLDKIKSDLEGRGIVFEKMMKQEDLTLGDMKKKIKEQIMIEKTIELQIKQDIIIQPSEIANYYKENVQDYAQPEQAAVCTILIKMDSVRTPLESRQLADDVRGMLSSGNDFREVAKNYTEGPNREAGGDLGYIAKGELLKEIDDVVFSMAIGDVSKVIESPVGYHICMVYDKKEEKITPLEEVRDKVHLSLYRVKVEKKFEDWLDKLKSNAYISIK